jgi:hypothetical protein
MALTTAEARAYLREEEWDQVRVSRDPLSKRNTIVRQITGIGVEVAEDLCQYLRDYTSSENTKARSFVVKPRTSRETQDGTWRSGRVWYETVRDDTTLFQELHEGWVEAFTDNTPYWTEAHLVSERFVDSATEGVLTVRWENIANDKVHAIASLMQANSYESVTIDGEEYGGTWFTRWIETREHDDGSAHIILTLQRSESYQEYLQGMGTLSPRTTRRYMGVPHSRIAEVIANHPSPTDSRTNIDHEVDMDYVAGTATIIVRTTNYTQVTNTTTLQVSFNTKQTVVRGWNYTLEEIEAFIAEGGTLDLITPEAGKSKSLVQTDNGNGTWDFIATVNLATLTSEVIVNEIRLIDAPELDRFNIGSESEIRRYRWFDIAPGDEDDVIDQIREVLEYAPTGWSVISRDETHDRESNTYTILWEISKVGDTEWITRKADIDGDSEVHIYELRNRKMDLTVPYEERIQPEPPEEEGYVGTTLFIENIDEVHQNYRWTYERVGTKDHYVADTFPSSEARRVTIEQLKRDATLVDEEGEEILPEVPEISTETVSYTLIDGPRFRESGARMRDIIYVFERDGETEWEVEQTENDGTNEGEVAIRQVILRNRTDLPEEEPTITGFVRVRRQITNPDQPHNDIIYTFQKEGTGFVYVRFHAPGGPKKVLNVMFYSRAEEPEQAEVERQIQEDLGESYTLMDIVVQGGAGLLQNYQYIFALDTPDGMEPDSVEGITVGIRTPFWVKRKTMVIPGVPDAELDARITFLADADNWGAYEVPESVLPRWDGSGQTDIYVTLVCLPTESTVETQSIFDPSDVAIRSNEWRYGISSEKIPLNHGGIPDSGTTTAWGQVTSVRTYVSPNQGDTVIGRAIRRRYVRTTTTYHKFMPEDGARNAHGETDLYYTYKLSREPSVGYWLEVETKVSTGNWAKSYEENVKLGYIPVEPPGADGSVFL